MLIFYQSWRTNHFITTFFIVAQENLCCIQPLLAFIHPKYCVGSTVPMLSQLMVVACGRRKNRAVHKGNNKFNDIMTKLSPSEISAYECSWLGRGW
jgi:hypothetical protein